jgi:hypothetical protein
VTTFLRTTGGLRQELRLGTGGWWVPPTRMQQGLERLAHVPDQMKPIGHLEGVRSCQTAREGIGVGTIAHQDRHSGMVLEPLHQGRGGASLQHGHGLSTFEIHQQGAIRAAPPECKLIHAQDARRGWEDRFRTLALNERVGARHLAQPAYLPRGHLCVAGMGQLQQDLTQVFCLARVSG